MELSSFILKYFSIRFLFFLNTVLRAIATLLASAWVFLFIVYRVYAFYPEITSE